MHSTKMHKHRTTEEEEEGVLCPSLSTHQVNSGLNLRLVCAAPRDLGFPCAHSSIMIVVSYIYYAFPIHPYK